MALLVLPFLTLFILFYALPIGYALWQSLFGLQRTSAYGAAERVFVGLDNYVDVLSDSAFRVSLLHVVQFGLGPSLLTVLLALFIALLIDARPNRAFAKVVRAAVFSPFAVPAVIGAILWGFLYAPGTSPVVSLAADLGWQVNPMDWPPLWVIGNVGIWTYVGFNVLIFLAGLAGVDPSILESARLDGASPLRIAWSIKLPMIRPSIVLSAVFNIVGTLQLFTEPTALRSLMTTISSDWTPNMLAYSEAAANRYSYSAAIATLLAIVTALVSFGLLRSAGPEQRP